MCTCLLKSNDWHMQHVQIQFVMCLSNCSVNITTCQTGKCPGDFKDDYGDRFEAPRVVIGQCIQVSRMEEATLEHAQGWRIACQAVTQHTHAFRKRPAGAADCEAPSNQEQR